MTKQQAASAAYQWAWNVSTDKHSLTVPMLCARQVMGVLDRFDRYEDAYDALLEMLDGWERERRAGFAAPLEAVRKAMGLVQTDFASRTMSA